MGFFTTSVIDMNQTGGIKSAEQVPSLDSLQHDFTLASAMDLEMDLDYLTGHPEFDIQPDDMEWEMFFPPVMDENALKASQGLNDLDDGNPAENSLETGFDASAVQLESHFMPGCPYDLNEEAAVEQPLGNTLGGFAVQLDEGCRPGFPNTHYVFSIPHSQFASAQELTSASQDNTIDPATLSGPAVNDSSDLFAISDFPDDDLNETLTENFELPNTLSELDFLQSLQLVGGGTNPAMTLCVGHNTQQLPHSTGYSATQNYEPTRVAWDGSPNPSRVVSAGSGEPNLENESRAVLTNPRRLSKGHHRGAPQRQSGRSRIHQNERYIQNPAYTPLTQAPESWDIFQYTKDGEIEPSRLFSGEEVNRLLFTHPLHRGHRNLKESQLRLRVHKTPASSAKRFPNGLKCRFKDCPMMHTINQGHYLLVLDELSVQYPDHDLYLNAAHFHLYCMERFCNFREICATLNVSAKGRDARKEEGQKNRFCLCLGEEEKVVEDFVEACCANGGRGNGLNPWVATCPDKRTEGSCPHYDQPTFPYKGSLSHQLVITKLHYGGQGRITLRKEREARAGYQGANITRHLGDLSKEAELREYSRSHKNQNQLKPNPKTVREYRGEEIEEEEEPDHSHSETSHPERHQSPAVGSSYQVQRTKRVREEVEDDQTPNHGIAQAHKKRRHHDPHLEIPEWNLDQSRSASGTGSGIERTVDSNGQNVRMPNAPGRSPRTTLTGRTHSQLQMTATSPPQDDRSASINGLRSMMLEDESEEDFELKMLAAQRRRRALEIEDVKDQEKEYMLRKLKLQKAGNNKRARDEGDDDGDGDWTDSRGKRQRV